MTKLSKTFSRERSLFYIRIWNDSDRMGISRWLGVNVLTSLFLRESNTNKMSVWYDLHQFWKIEKKIESTILANENIVEEMTAVLKGQWGKMSPLLEGSKKITNSDEFEFFFTETVKWWSVMAIFFMVPNLKKVPQRIKDKTLEFRLQVEKYSDKIDQTLVGYFESVLPQYKDISFVIQPEEAFQLSRSGLSDEELRNIRARLGGFALLNSRLYLIRDFGKVMQDHGLVLEEEKVDVSMSEIKGSPASKGFGRGKVRLVLLKSQVSELQEGEVLVTEMTNPDFVPAMKKAAAIITDEGGITCHAAIVSRELGKPCVIGTRIATKVLKDSDVVEVDADRGVVRKLS